MSNFVAAGNKLNALDTLERLVTDRLNLSRDQIVGILQYQQEHCTFIDEALCRCFYGSSVSELLNTAEHISEEAMADLSANVKRIVSESKAQIGHDFLVYSSFIIAVGSIVSVMQVISMYQELSVAKNVSSSSRAKLDGIIKKKIDESNAHLSAAVKYLTEGKNDTNKKHAACLRISRASSCASEAREELQSIEIKIGTSTHQLGQMRTTSACTALSSTVLTTVQLLSIIAAVPTGGVAQWAKVFAWAVAATQAGIAGASAAAYVISGNRLKELQDLNEEVMKQKKVLQELVQLIDKTNQEIESLFTN